MLRALQNLLHYYILKFTINNELRGKTVTSQTPGGNYLFRHLPRKRKIHKINMLLDSPLSRRMTALRVIEKLRKTEQKTGVYKRVDENFDRGFNKANRVYRKL